MPGCSKDFPKRRDRLRISYYVRITANREERMAKRIVNIRLRPDQEERINAIVARSAILDTSKFVRIAVDWLLMSDIGEVLKKIVDVEKFPDYAMPKKPTARKRRKQRKPRRS